MELDAGVGGAEVAEVSDAIVDNSTLLNLISSLSYLPHVSLEYLGLSEVKAIGTRKSTTCFNSSSPYTHNLDY